MGCGGSKDAAGDVSVPGELATNESEVEINLPDIKGRLKELTSVKLAHNLLLFEKYGIESVLAQCRDELSSLTMTQQKAKDGYEFLLQYAMERDADDVFRALQASQIDKRVLIDILTSRTKWQLEMIGNIYEKKHNVSLIREIQRNLRTSLGRLTGSQSGLGRLLLFVCTDQPERDGQLLTNHIKDMDIIIEIVSTRTNRELRGALDWYKAQHGKDFAEVVRSKSYRNFGALMSGVLECRRDESGSGFDPEFAACVASNLETAATKKDADVYVQVFSNLSYQQFLSVNAVYRGNNLVEDLKKFSGDFYSLLCARCTHKYALLCGRLMEDKDSISRILGCMPRKECQRLREHFNENKAKYGGGLTLENVLKEAITKESFLAACLNLISSDTHLFPLGVDRELGEDEVLVGSIGEEVMQAAKESYNRGNMRELGEKEAARLGIDTEITKKKAPRMNKKQMAEYIASIDEEIETTKSNVQALKSEVAHHLDLYFTMTRHIAEAKEWAQLYDTYSEMLNKHIAIKDTAAAAAFGQKNGSYKSS
mmetsp:Transcript_3601/g.5585  ORF Transcript_3601/g.5585 Transcript_3601/m.5585 type:complete len:539 (-) Transcript_3601:148-1764(-)|eukprot:CAMPEP_0185038544 /NCGR_PEP_ID=MMETSP1103-20130426/34319_1 /TAXON_ID=36769 /ORGANISM="Paraphysomonas bandaiensis, Strain Caron Lab Isolate" /LENGTH=538 /DNA_ID=CAMNT_0027577017 /DNA_START=22 /DNA_END=1638 /DNA_ORIENTATION=+